LDLEDDILKKLLSMPHDTVPFQLRYALLLAGLHTTHTGPEERRFSRPSKIEIYIQQNYAREEPLEFNVYEKQTGLELDVYHAGSKLNIELDGPWHNSVMQKRLDALRDQALGNIGIQVSRIPIVGNKNQILQNVHNLVDLVTNPFSTLIRKSSSYTPDK
jgi:very-short-patch-repair endonuclease